MQKKLFFLSELLIVINQKSSRYHGNFNSSKHTSVSIFDIFLCINFISSFLLKTGNDFFEAFIDLQIVVVVVVVVVVKTAALKNAVPSVPSS